MMWIILLLCLVGCSMTAYATGPETVFDMNGLLEEIGADDLVDALPQDTQDLLEELGMDRLSVEGILRLTPGQFWKLTKSLALKEIRKPIQAFCSVVGIVLLCALLEGARHTAGNSSITPVFHMVAALAIALTVAGPVVSCIRDTGQTVRDCSAFLLAFIPVFTGVLVAGGQAMTAATYHLFLFFACQVASQLICQMLLPLVGIYMGLALVTSAMPEANLGSLPKFFRSTIVWALGLVLSLFVGLLSVQSVVASSGDSVTGKATKFLLGSFIPVVGSALSDAFMAAQGCIRLLKTTLGGFGVLVAAVTFLPILLRTGCWYLVLQISSAAGEVLGLKQVTGLLKGIAGGIAVLISIMLTFMLMVILSTALLLMLGVAA